MVEGVAWTTAERQGGLCVEGRGGKCLEQPEKNSAKVSLRISLHLPGASPPPVHRFEAEAEAACCLPLLRRAQRRRGALLTTRSARRLRR